MSIERLVPLLAVGLLAVSNLLCVNSNAQVSSGSLSGTVTDPQGAVVAGAQVVLLDDRSNELKRTVANEDGYYQLENITGGKYILDARQLSRQKLHTMECV